MSAANIFEALREQSENRDSDDALSFEPNPNSRHFKPTAAPAGSAEKRAVMRRRLTLGLPLFHPDDNPLSVALSPYIKKPTQKELQEIEDEIEVEVDCE